MVTMNEANVKCKLRFPSLSAIPMVADGGELYELSICRLDNVTKMTIHWRDVYRLVFPPFILLPRGRLTAVAEQTLFLLLLYLPANKSVLSGE